MVAEEMAQVRWAPQEVVVRPPETLIGGKLKRQMSSRGKEEAGVASQGRLNRGKSECGFPRDTGHQRAGERDDLGRNPSF